MANMAKNANVPCGAIRAKTGYFSGKNRYKTVTKLSGFLAPYWVM